jgi:hypothetical protein
MTILRSVLCVAPSTHDSSISWCVRGIVGSRVWCFVSCAWQRILTQVVLDAQKFQDMEDSEDRLIRDAEATGEVGT